MKLPNLGKDAADWVKPSSKFQCSLYPMSTVYLENYYIYWCSDLNSKIVTMFFEFF